MERFSEKIVVSDIDFDDLVKDLPFLSKNELTFNELKKRLYEEAKKSNNEKSNYILWLFADMLEISLNVNGRDYEATLVFYGQGRSMLPSDLASSDIDFLVSIYEKVQNIHLKVRIADLLWYLKVKPKNPNYAEFVIENYLNLPFSESTDFYHNQAFLSRAIILAKQMKKNQLIDEFSKKVYLVFNTHKYDGHAYLFQLSDFMYKNFLCINNAVEISKKLDEFGELCEKNNNFNLAGSYYAHASLWANKYDEYRAIELQIKNAKSCIHSAEYIENNGIAKTVFYEQALSIIRSLPKEKRRAFISDMEERDIADKIRQAGQFSLTEMKEHSLSLDLSECIAQIENGIKGKSKEEALKFLSLLNSNITFKNIEETAIRNIKNSPLLSMFPKQFYSKDGRLIAQTKGYDSKNELTAEDENVWQQMIFTYSMYILVHVQGVVFPALNIFTNEHNISFRELNEIVLKSTLFPNDRKSIVTKGLLAGFEYDFITALHLLTPQLENMVRYKLRLANVKTSGIDKDGIETENGLSTLIKYPEFEQIFGKDLAFEIKALMCDSFGPNLRNNVAHGLLDANEMQSHYAIYLWWFCLKLIYIDFWNSFRNGEK